MRNLLTISFFAALVSALLVSPTSDTRAQVDQTLRIVAVVNDDVISEYDLANRIGLVVTLSNLPNRPEVRRQVAPRVLRALIDETLRVQDAEELGIEAPEQAVDDALARVAERNNIKADQLLELLARRNVDPETLISQMTAEVLWGQTIFRRFGGLVNVTDAEVEAAVAEAREAIGKPEYNVAEIYIAEDQDSSPSEHRRQANQLVRQIRNGAAFPALAQSFSQLPTAANGGQLGWVRLDQLPSEVAQVVSTMFPGTVSEPIPVTGGLYIIGLLDKRISGQRTTGVAEVSLTQLHLAVPADTPENTVNQYLNAAREKASSANNCEEFETLAQSFGSPVSGSLGTVALNRLPRSIQAAVKDLKIGETTQPIRNQDSIIVLMVCDRNDPTTEMMEIDPEEIRNQLFNRRLNHFARNHLRELQRSAFIDVRL